MSQWWYNTIEYLSSPRAVGILRGVAILVLGLILARVIGSLLGRVVGRRGTAQQAMIFRRASFYILALLVVITALRHFGFDLKVLLGAAGILTVAIGFASQTSASNLISGLFLIGERPFVVGDVIKVGETMGWVTSIDALSVKIRTYDNLLVRIPNESLLKTQLTNVTHHPIRRVDIKMGVAYKEDIGKVRETLMQVAEKIPICLDEPKPGFFFLGFGDSALEFQFSAWGVREKYFELKTALYREIKKAFDEAGIEIPFPHRTLYAGSVTEPFPVRVVSNTGDSREATDPTNGSGEQTVSRVATASAE
jgi:small-conductance mechanosensitive channel